MIIVLIDDERDVHCVAGPFLEGEGFTVLSAQDGQTGLRLIKNHSPDLVVLDIYMPDMDGWEVCRQIRTFSNVPILMISAIATDPADEVHGLELGASSYLLKPLNLRVFLARINALIRLSKTGGDNSSYHVYVDDYLTIDLDREECFVKGERVSLTYLEQSMLSLLVRNVDQTIPTAEIIEELWPDGSPEDNIKYVRIYIGRLRRRIEPDYRNPRYIRNYHGFGYRFCSNYWS